MTEDREFMTALDWLELANDVAVDYDGCNTVESLQSLVDEMSEYIANARRLLWDSAEEAPRDALDARDTTNGG